MATIVVMPQLGNSVESCIIVEWQVSVGDTVAVDQTLCSIETDKSTMEVPSTDAGTVLKILWEEGDEVPVKDPLIIVGEPGEDISALVPADDSADEADAAEAAPESAPAKEATPAPSFATTAATGAVSPRARVLAGSKGIDTATIAEGSGPHGRVIERDAQGRPQGCCFAHDGIPAGVGTADPQHDGQRSRHSCDAQEGQELGRSSGPQQDHPERPRLLRSVPHAPEVPGFQRSPRRWHPDQVRAGSPRLRSRYSARSFGSRDPLRSGPVTQAVLCSGKEPRS